jgi:hypothetical protein
MYKIYPEEQFYSSNYEDQKSGNHSSTIVVVTSRF